MSVNNSPVLKNVSFSVGFWHSRRLTGAPPFMCVKLSNTHHIPVDLFTKSSPKIRISQQTEENVCQLIPTLYQCQAFW